MERGYIPGEITFMPFRHGPKSDEKAGLDSAVLSEVGKVAVQEKAQDLFLEIDSLPDGSVIFFSTSLTDRAVQTRDLMEEEVKKLISNNANYAIVDVGEFSSKNYEESGLKKKIEENPTIKFFITGINPTSLLSIKSKGMKEDRGVEQVVDVQSNNYFVKCKNFFENKEAEEGDKYDESLASALWLAHADEMPDLKNKIKGKFPAVSGDDVELLNPKNFVETPEDAAIKQANYFKRIAELSRKYFGKRPVFSPTVTHSPKVDFLTMKLLGLSLSAHDFEQIGGQRAFLEASKLAIKDDSICVEFRGKTNCLSDTDLDMIISELNVENQNRKKEWELIK